MDLRNESDKKNPRASASFLESCIIKTAESNRLSFELLYHETKNGVYSFALSYLRNPADAEDVLQETYIKIWTAAGSYRPRGSPMAWILTIAKNLSLMKLRERKSDAGLSAEELIAFYPAEDLPSSDDRLILESAFSHLTDEERNIVTLHGVSGLKHREIAALMSMPVSTVLSKYHRAKKKLRAFIERGDED